MRLEERPRQEGGKGLGAWFIGVELLVKKMENMSGDFLGPKPESAAVRPLTSDKKAYSLRSRTMM